MKTILSTIIDSLEKLHEGFEINELAQYALTSNAEHPGGDPLAYRLNLHISKHSELSDYMCVREWNRCDLAFFHMPTKQLEQILELKAGYTYDPLLKTPRRYDDLAKKDIEKAVSKAGSKYPNHNSSIYNILFLAHVSHLSDNLPAGIVTYENQIKRRLSVYDTDQEMKQAAISAIESQLIDFVVHARGKIPAGEHLSTHVELLYWLFEIN